MMKPQHILVALLASLTTLLAPTDGSGQPAGMVGEDFTRRDRAELLYSTKFHFSNDHIPTVTVMVLEGEKTAVFESAAPMIFQPEGEGGTSVTVGKGRTRCSAGIRDGKKAQIRHWVALSRLPAGNLKRLRKARKDWKRSGLDVRSFEQGSVFGFFGRVLDNRVMILVEDSPFDDLAAARGRRDELVGLTGEGTLEVFEEAVVRPSGTVVVTCEGTDAVMEFPGMVEVAATGDTVLTVRDVEFGKGFHWHGREDRTYRGRLILTPDRRGSLAVVNAVGAGTLLKGLVPSEIFNDAPMDALKAQAVTARGELFAKLGTRHSADPYMVCADVHCQVYRGSTREHPRTSRAVEATRGQMMFHDGRLVDSVYSASCGGHTESGRMVWQGSDHPYLGGVSDAAGDVDIFGESVTEEAVRTFVEHPPKGLYCGSTRYTKKSFRWSRDVSFEEVRKGTLKFTGKDTGPVRGLVVLERGVSGRVTRLEVKGDVASAILSPELIIRKAFGSLRSSLFVFNVVSEPKGDLFRFRGAGFGHGVGMCQYGAIGRAAVGHKFDEILQHYYTGADVVRIY